MERLNSFQSSIIAWRSSYSGRTCHEEKKFIIKKTCWKICLSNTVSIIILLLKSPVDRIYRSMTADWTVLSSLSPSPGLGSRGADSIRAPLHAETVKTVWHKFFLWQNRMIAIRRAARKCVTFIFSLIPIWIHVSCECGKSGPSWFHKSPELSFIQTSAIMRRRKTSRSSSSVMIVIKILLVVAISCNLISESRWVVATN